MRRKHVNETTRTRHEAQSRRGRQRVPLFPDYRFVGLAAIAHAFSLSPKRARQLIEQGDLPVQRDQRGEWYTTSADIDAWVLALSEKSEEAHRRGDKDWKTVTVTPEDIAQAR